jgi:hypothetical protein
MRRPFRQTHGIGWRAGSNRDRTIGKYLFLRTLAGEVCIALKAIYATIESNTWCRTRARCSAASKFRVAVPKRIRVASASGACMLVTSITASTPTSALSTPSTVDTSTPRARATQWSRDPPSATSSPYSDRQHRCRRSSATRIGILRINEKESAVG